LQANEEVPEPWQSWQTAAIATPVEIMVAANPMMTVRRETFLTDFMVLVYV
jgi:hypothetical protein